MSEASENERTADQEEQFTIAGETLPEFFHPDMGGKLVTRRQLQDVLRLFASKTDVEQGLNVVSFELRRAVRQIVAEELKTTEGPDETRRSDIVIPEGLK